MGIIYESIEIPEARMFLRLGFSNVTMQMPSLVHTIPRNSQPCSLVSLTTSSSSVLDPSQLDSCSHSLTLVVTRPTVFIASGGLSTFLYRPGLPASDQE